MSDQSDSTDKQCPVLCIVWQEWQYVDQLPDVVMGAKRDSTNEQCPDVVMGDKSDSTNDYVLIGDGWLKWQHRWAMSYPDVVMCDKWQYEWSVSWCSDMWQRDSADDQCPDVVMSDRSDSTYDQCPDLDMGD